MPKRLIVLFALYADRKAAGQLRKLRLTGQLRKLRLTGQLKTSRSAADDYKEVGYGQR